MKVKIDCEADISKAIQAGFDISKKIGFSNTKQSMIATAISELSRNILVYAQTGEIRLTAIKKGIKVIANDNGPGIENLKLAMTENHSTANTLGIGLPGTKRLMDSFSIESTLGIGTTIIIKKWL